MLLPLVSKANGNLIQASTAGSRRQDFPYGGGGKLPTEDSTRKPRKGDEFPKDGEPEMRKFWELHTYRTQLGSRRS